MTAIYSKLLLVLMIFPLFLEPSGKHPLHVSTTEIEFNSKEKSLEISCRIFTDDFETVLAKQFKTKVDLNKQTMHTAMDELVKKYINANLHYKVNGKNLTATYVGFEKDNEATNIYFEIDNISSLQSLNLTNTILYDLFDDQMNILHVVNAATRKSVRANYPNKGLNVAF
ncbi:hypothetical protein EZ428_04935 [Pedobacter frigiditerrae]|uniref:Uncharacterized protein n=1 Tax=Pedobacter frigiditerrae TaxID=2530452 RepID=A0A4V2MJG0_9SPHI|nr:DUF6702 family protein [Pedobacter frigiditerrae]TCC94126.1 hypothetical protein EZ428_04935 [Pedobacter frigiditerrae]